MPSTQTLQPSSPPSLPLAVPQKGSHYTPLSQPTPYRRTALSPPQPGSSVASSAVPSLTSGSYASSATGDESFNGGAPGIDLAELLNDRLSNAVNPLPLDRSLARQAQTSGELNAKHREMLELQALAQRRLKSTRANFADGMQAAKEVRRDLEWTQKRVSTLKTKAEKRHPTAYRTANQRYPTAVDC